jgi:hypothetical protein
MVGVVRAGLVVALVLGALLPASAAEPEKKKRFEWDVPGMVSQVEVEGVQVALGIPMKLHAVTSSWKPTDLFRHFATQFKEQGFYIPPPSHQVVVHGAMSLTALDVNRDLTYTVFLRVNPDGKTTRVLLGTANVGQIRNPSADNTFAPVYPGASQLVTSDVEAGRSLSYVITATAEQLAAFYRDAMKAAGWEEKRPGTYRKGSERVVVMARPLEKGQLSVVVLGGYLARDDEDLTE